MHKHTHTNRMTQTTSYTYTHSKKTTTQRERERDGNTGASCLGRVKCRVLELQGRRLVPDTTRGVLRVLRTPATGALLLEWRPRDAATATAATHPPLEFTATAAAPLRLEAIPGQRAVSLRVGGEKHRAFFWLQTPTNEAASDASRIAALNAALTPSPPPTPSPPSAPAPAPAPAARGIDLSVLRAIMQQLSSTHAASGGGDDDDADLVDVLRPTDVCDILRAAPPAVRDALFPHIPDEAPHDITGLCEIVFSPQFRQAVEAFELAIKSGDAGQLLAELGLHLSAQGPAGGVKRFLNVCCALSLYLLPFCCAPPPFNIAVEQALIEKAKKPS